MLMLYTSAITVWIQIERASPNTTVLITARARFPVNCTISRPNATNMIALHPAA